MIRAAALLALAACAHAPALVWHDEFDGAAGAVADGAKWVPETGGDGNGNQEREYYTEHANAALDGDGHLVITARAEPAPDGKTCWYGVCQYTSGRIRTLGKFARAYGRFEARIKVPRGQGMWPAFWMMGDNIEKAGWPQGGEIDIMEIIGKLPATVHGTVHGPGYSGDKGIGKSDTLRSGIYADDFHVYAVEWRPNEIKWFVDDRLYHTFTPANLPAGKAWVFDHPFFLLLNLAVGGGWPGDPDATTVLPQQMIVDYVRVYAL